FSKSNDFKGVPPPLNGDFTPTPQEEINDSLYVYVKYGPQKPATSISDDNSTEDSTCQSNDSEGSFGNPSENSFESDSEPISVPNEISTFKPVEINETVVSKSTPTDVDPSCASYVNTPRQQMKNFETPNVNRQNWNAMMERELREGYSFTKKKYFVSGSLCHLIKDCDYYEKKMAREAELKKQRVFNTGSGVVKPVWTNANRVNHANHFVPRPVQLNAVRPNVNSVRSNFNTRRAHVNSVRATVNAVRPNVNSVRSNFNTGRQNVNSVWSNVNTVRSKQPALQITQTVLVLRPIVENTAKMSDSNAVKGKWGTAVKTSAGYTWRKTRPNFNYNSGSNFVSSVNVKGPQGRPKPVKAWVPKRN
ncbi:hypothetical protein Tco_0757584, partial [Tanacetum coccineum]